MTGETDLMHDSLRRDLQRYRDAESQSDRERIRNRMIDTIAEVQGWHETRATSYVGDLIRLDQLAQLL